MRKKRSSYNPSLIEDWNEDIAPGDLAPDGGQWRPHIVWFGESVPMMMPAAQAVESADALIIVGTPPGIYPAASLVDFAPGACTCFSG
ncbi:MAG: Sir2 family NAD-dependent protein deacetylase [Bacteroidia bacterium]